MVSAFGHHNLKIDENLKHWDKKRVFRKVCREFNERIGCATFSAETGITVDPCVSALGMVVYGLLHHEPVAIRDEIVWNAPEGWTPVDDSYYAAQGNAYRIFFRSDLTKLLPDWKVIERTRMAAISYVASGGYSKPQLYPDAAFGFMRWIDGVCDLMPALFATRLMAVVEAPR
jgi:hypothetical protein